MSEEKKFKKTCTKLVYKVTFKRFLLSIWLINARANFPVLKRSQITLLKYGYV